VTAHPTGNRAPRKPDPPNTHGACGTTWTGTRAAHCSGCCRTFSGSSLFDAHRRGYGDRGSCLDPVALGAEFRDGMWRAPEMTDEEKLARFGDRQAS
jgi:hypothetical protein